MTCNQDTKIALITGASRGIGAAIARGLAVDGFDIWLNYATSDNAAKSVQDDIESMGRKCLLLKFDVTNANHVKESLAGLLDQNTPFALINNAGIAKDGMFGLMSGADWQNVLDVSLGGFFNVTRTVLPYMQRKKRGRVVNITSVSGQAGTPGQVNYSTAKAGIIGATKALAREVAKRNILVNAVAPGLIETDMTKELPLENMLAGIPTGRIGKDFEVAGPVRFLCSDLASYVTGQVIGVNGGLYT